MCLLRELELSTSLFFHGTCLRASIAVATFLVCFGLLTPTWATPVNGKSDDCSKGGTIVEKNFNNNPMHFTLHLTDKTNGGQEIMGNGFPMDLGVIQPGGEVPVQVQIPGLNHCDAFNTCVAVGGAGGGGGGVGGGGGAVLRLESLFFNVNTSEYELESIFDFVGKAVGIGSFVAVPDLYADTNGDTQIGAGDLLYSLVDLHAFLNSGNGPIPTFAPNQTFSIVNGMVASLPGMLFSTTAFTFTPSGGYSGTPYTGTGLAATDHEVAQTPEPGTLLLGTCGLIGFAFRRRFRPNAAANIRQR